MAVNVDDKIKKLSSVQRKKVEARAIELLAEEMTLRELRHARKLTQVRMARALGITQDSVSRLEKRSDLLLSRRWAGSCLLWPSFQIARRWC
jgi:DNA-binding XRE family transcriptional regulator